MTKPLDTDYFQLLCLEVDFLDAGFDLIAARQMAIEELQRRKNADDQFDIHVDNWCGNG